MESLRATQTRVAEGTTVLTVADREADLFELLAEPRPAHSELLIRASRPRCLVGEEGQLWEAVAAQAPAGERVVCFRRRPDRAAREARLALRFRPVTIRPPRHGKHDPNLRPVTVTAIAATEVDPPAGEKPVCWRLLTTLSVTTLAEAQRCLDYYAHRWLIERYHYTLKSGCHVEASQLRTLDRQLRLLALYCVVAWQLLWLTYVAREHGDQPCTIAFSRQEWELLYLLRHRRRPRLKAPPTLWEAVRWLAGLGGFLGRRGDGDPGVKVLWRGWQRFQLALLTARLLAHQDVGNA